MYNASNKTASYYYIVYVTFAYGGSLATTIFKDIKRKALSYYTLIIVLIIVHMQM